MGFFSLMRQKLRTFLTAIALSIGIASVVVIMSAGNGLKYMVLSELDIYSPNTINIEVRVPGKGETGSATSMAVAMMAPRGNSSSLSGVPTMRLRCWALNSNTSPLPPSSSDRLISSLGRT